jgi:hypothetical protein
VGRTCGPHGRGEGSVQGFWCKSLKERDHLEDQGIDGRMGSEWISGILAWGVQSGSIWLSIGAYDGLL